MKFNLNIENIHLIVHSIARNLNYKIIVNRKILEEINIRTTDYLNSLKNPSYFKVAGAYIFWIRKLKPAFLYPVKGKDVELLHLNELLAVIYGIVILKFYLKSDYKPYTKKFKQDLAIQLRYSSFSPFSPSSLALLLESKYK